MKIKLETMGKLERKDILKKPDTSTAWVIFWLTIILLISIMIGNASGTDVAPKGYPYDRFVHGFKLTNGFYAKRSYGIHGAWDIAMPVGTPLKAMMSGVVTVHSSHSAGMYVLIKSGDYEVMYAHLSTIELRNLIDGRVEYGEVIAYSGDIGADVTGPHLHLQIMKNGKKVSPDSYFKSL